MKLLGTKFNANHVAALLRKDYLVRRRTWHMTLVQYIWPCIVFFALYLLRNRFREYTTEECQFPTRQLPSTNNLLPTFHSYICTIENKCMDPEDFQEVPNYESAPITPIINIVQLFLNEEKLYNAIIKLPLEKNFIGTVIAIVTHPKFTIIESNGNKLREFLPQIERIVGTDFDPTSLFSNSRSLANFGKIICASPFPTGEGTIPIVKNVLESEDYSQGETRETRSVPSDYCQKLFRDITKSNTGKIAWSVIKPVIQGKILFGPDTERNREIVKHANSTFNDMARLSVFLKSVDKTFAMLNNDKEFREKYDQLIRLAKSPLVKQLAGDSFNADEIETILNGILNDKRIASTVNVIANVFDCYSVDRFVPVQDETELENTAFDLSRHKMLYAAIYFPDNSTKDITYKLRVDVDNTPVTAHSQNLYWFPGPEGSFALDMRYHRGFIQIQQSLDMAIIEIERLKHAENETIESEFAESGPQTTTPSDDFGEFEDEDDDDDDDFGEFDDDDDVKVNVTAVPVISLKNSTENPQIVTTTTTTTTVKTTTPAEDDLDFSSTEKVESVTLRGPRRKKRQLTNLLDTFFNRPKTIQQTKFDDLKFYTKQFPYPSYITDDFKRGLYMANAVQLAFFFALIVQVASSVRHRIWMKESGNSTLMRTMGLVKSAEIISWVMTSLFELALIFLLVSFIMFIGGMLSWVNKGFLYFFLFVFGCSVVAFSFMVSTFFSSASIATVSAVIFFLITFLPYIIVVSLGTLFSFTGRVIASLSVSTAFCYAWRYILRLELQNKPFSFARAFEGSFTENDFLFGFVMILVDLVLYIIIGAICEHFLRDDNNFYEVTRKNINRDHGAEVVNVTKIYNQRGRKAVDNVSLVFRRDEVTALLGRNGAGKSTIIKMLTGQLEPTMGEINLPPNYDLISGNKNNQEKIGLCPQNNVLIPNLTAKEHLELYAKIKMRSGYSKEIKRILNSLNFGKRKKYEAQELSGGYKRRLCIAIAFLASPNLVILDEPCSGVDTRARKNIWDLIQSLRKGRAVVLATHFMDEAERLSDKIVIVNHGQVVSESNAEHLAKEFTKAFDLNIQLHQTLSDKEKTSITEHTRNLVKEHAPGIKRAELNGTTYSLNVPYKNERAEYHKLEPLVKSLQNLQVQKKIQSFNITTQNLKDIFNRFNQGETNGSNGNQEINGNTEIPLKDMEEEVNINWLSIVGNLFWKRWVHFTRNYRMLLAILVLPVVFECLAMLFLKIRPPGEYDIALTLGKNLYPHSTEFYSFQESTKENDTSSAFTTPIYANLIADCDDHCKLFNSSKTASKWLLDTEMDYIEKRYGGVTINETILEVWYNNKGYHSMPVFLNALNNALLKKISNESSITIINHPLELGDSGISYSSILQQVADAMVALIILIAFSLVLAAASVYIVNERVNGEKLQQRLCGVNFVTYWGVTFVWDFIIYLIALASAAAVFVIFNIPLYTEKEQLGGICLLLFLFGFAIIPAIHLFEKLFSEPSFANMTLFCLNVIIALTTMVLLLIMEVIGTSEAEEEFRKILNKVLIVLPQHALGDGLRQIVQNYIAAKMLERFSINTYKSPVTSNLLFPHFVSLIVVGIVCHIINYIIESKIVPRLLTKTEDSQSSTVATELEFISIQNTLKRIDTFDMARHDMALSVQNLKKKYHGHNDYAVQNVTFHVKDGECFGLLGANGAGKSTIFAILCGEILQTSGSVKLRSERGISYCPQSNALDPLLTVAEVIQFYGQLRRIRNIEQLTKRTLESLHLSQYKHVLVKNLSGGNRRKLSVAVTCFGNTNIVLMDEPTSDMDPITRGLVYKVIRGLIKSNRAVVLTSHSISEIESICHKIAVLKDGKILSMGSPRHLKDSYGNNYLVTVFLLKESDQVNILSIFPTATRILQQNHSIQFVVKVKFSEDEIENGDIHPDGDDDNNTKKILLSDLFAKLHSLSISHKIMYTVSECLLDQVMESILENSDPETSKGYVNKAYKQTETLT